MRCECAKALSLPGDETTGQSGRVRGVLLLQRGGTLEMQLLRWAGVIGILVAAAAMTAEAGDDPSPVFRMR